MSDSIKVTGNDLTVRPLYEWVSVKDRMPKIGEFRRNEVLTWDGREMNVRIPSFSNDGRAAFFHLTGDPLITHWMPPPEPPK